MFCKLIVIKVLDPRFAAAAAAQIQRALHQLQ
jgi:hypothetical protein